MFGQIKDKPMTREEMEQRLQAYRSEDLFAPTNAYTPDYSSGRKAYQAVLPRSDHDDGAMCLKSFDCKRLNQTAVVSVCNGSTETKDAFDISLKEVIRNTMNAIGMILDETGEYQATCVLISEDRILLARHSIEGVGDISGYSVLFSYFDKDGEKFAYKFLRVIDEDTELDYAIVQLTEKPKNNIPLSLKPDIDFHGSELALLHHPLGKPLQISVHEALSSNFGAQIQTYHDTDFASSGGAYIDPEGNLVALHLGCTAEDAAQDSFNLKRHALKVTTILEKMRKSNRVALPQLPLRPGNHPFIEVEMRERRKKFLKDQELRKQQQQATQRTGARLAKHDAAQYEAKSVRELAASFPELGASILASNNITSPNSSNKTIFHNPNSGWYVCLDTGTATPYNTVCICKPGQLPRPGDTHVALDRTMSSTGQGEEFHFINKGAAQGKKARA